MADTYSKNPNKKGQEFIAREEVDILKQERASMISFFADIKKYLLWICYVSFVIAGVAVFFFIRFIFVPA